jgi:hypothetical protein
MHFVYLGNYTYAMVPFVESGETKYNHFLSSCYMLSHKQMPLGVALCKKINSPKAFT